MFIRIVVLLILLASCSAPPEKAIVNRWKAVDVIGHGRERFLALQARAKEQGKDLQTRDLEFTKDGKFNGYNEEGVLDGQGTYTMAPDGKSLLLQMPGSSQTMPVKIIELSSGNLKVTSQIFDEDTVVMKPR